MRNSIRVLMAIVALAAFSFALPLSFAAQSEGGQGSQQNVARQGAQSQIFTVLGQRINIDNLDPKGMGDIVRDPITGAPVSLKMRGDIECTADKLKLRCSLLDISVEKGQLEARGKEGAPARIEQSGLKASADLIVLLDEGTMRLEGNVHVVQEADGFRTEIFGDFFERTELSDGRAQLSVKENARTLRKAIAATAAADQITQQTVTTSGVGEQSRSLSMGLGQDFELTVDPVKGEFLLILSAEGGVIESFTARNDVHLNANNGELKIDCTQLDLRENGQRIAATGLPVRVHQGGLDASSRSFSYDAQAGISLLKGDARIDSNDAGGFAFQSQAVEEIEIIEKGADGLMHIKYYGLSTIALQQNAETTTNDVSATTTKSTSQTLVFKIEK